MMPRHFTYCIFRQVAADQMEKIAICASGESAQTRPYIGTLTAAIRRILETCLALHATYMDGHLVRALNEVRASAVGGGRISGIVD